MGVGGAGGLGSAPAVEPRQPGPFQKVIGLFDGAGFHQAKLLDQSVLGGLEEPLDASLGLGAVGKDQLDPEVFQGPGKLRRRGPGIAGVVILGSEDAVTVHVHPHHPTVLSQIPSQQVHVGFGCLGGVEPCRDLAGGIVDHGHQDHPRASSFQPVVMAAVGLHQLPNTLPTFTPTAMLVPLALPGPQPISQHPTPKCLMVDHQTSRQQLLGRQGWSKTHVLLPVCLQCRLPHPSVLGPVRRPPTLAVNHPKVAFLLQTTLETSYLPYAQAQ